MVDFLVLGTAKAGTTSLHRLLDAHPQTSLSQPKETWYFDGADPELTLDDYLAKYFPISPDAKVRGEVATSYLYVPYVAERIARELPDTRLIAILRDPIDRAYSDWWMMYTRGWDPLPFDEAIEENLRRLDNGPDFSNPKDWADHLAAIRERGAVRYRTYVDYGFYGTQLARYRDAGLGNRLLILQFEQMKREGVSYLERVFDFLDLAPPQPDELVTAFAERQNEALPSRRVGQLVELMQRSGAAGIVPKGAKQAIKAWLSTRRNSRAISPDTTSRLEQIYRAQARDLACYGELDLSLWPSMRDGKA